MHILQINLYFYIKLYTVRKIFKCTAFNHPKMSKKKEEMAHQEELERDITRLRLPKGKQSFGLIEQRLGGNRMKVRCLDGKTRVCRIPGRLKRKLWVREGDFTIVEPWEYCGDQKGDIILKYKPSQVQYLKNSGHLKSLEEADGF